MGRHNRNDVNEPTTEIAESEKTADASAPELVDSKAAKKFLHVGSELPTEVHPAWAGTYQLLHGRLPIRTWRELPNQVDREGKPLKELITQWYDRGVIVKLSAIDAHRMYHLGVIMRCDEDGNEVEMPLDIRSTKLEKKNDRLKLAFGERDAEFRGERGSEWGFPKNAEA